MARKTKGLTQRNQFIILTNGKNSEQDYFLALQAKGRSIYDIRIEFENAAPIDLIKRAVKEKRGSNRIWIVFDKDEFPSDSINSVFADARKNGIGVAFSNAAFEVWLIDHFRTMDQEKTARELRLELDRLLKNQGYSKGYDKNDKAVHTEMFIPRIDEAMHNAEVSLQQRILEHKRMSPNVKDLPYCEWNSSTTVHKLVEALKLESR